MTRKDSLIRLHARLVTQRDELRRKLSLPPIHSGKETGGDSADMASHDIEQELESQLISLESRELVRIDKAIEAIRNGTYGQCELCGTRIPIARLQALPHTSSCIECQRKYENRASHRGQEVNWESAWSFQSPESDRDLTMKDIQLEME